jgi:hypothetical protein
LGNQKCQTIIYGTRQARKQQAALLKRTLSTDDLGQEAIDWANQCLGFQGTKGSVSLRNTRVAQNRDNQLKDMRTDRRPKRKGNLARFRAK